MRGRLVRRSFSEGGICLPAVAYGEGGFEAAGVAAE